MVMSAVGIQTVKSATGLGNALEGSLGDFFDSWLSTTSLTVSALTSMLISHCHVTKQNNLELGSALYNTIAGYINYLYKVPQIFTPVDDPFFTFDMPGNYFVVPYTTFLSGNSTRYGFDCTDFFSGLGFTLCRFQRSYSSLPIKDLLQ